MSVRRLGSAFGHGPMMMRLNKFPKEQHVEPGLDRELPRAILIRLNRAVATRAARVKIATPKTVGGVTLRMILDNGALPKANVGASLLRRRLTSGHSAVPTTTLENVVLTAPLVIGPGLTTTL